MIGTTLSHYKIVSELGRGGMGIVYKAEDTKLDRTVALKILPATALTSDEDRARFHREAKSAAALNHQHIAAIHEIDEAVPEGGSSEQPRPFIAMEFIDGQTLEDHINEGPLTLEEAVRITSQVALALEAAHEKGIIHRDIKSANVMLTAKGEAKVLDFGLAKTRHSTMLTRMGSTLGTVAYMSPEQARGENVDHRTDIWALGVLFYELISGRLPFGGDYEQAVTYSIMNEDPQPLTAIRTGVPMGLEWIVGKLLAKKVDDRYQTAKDLIVDLRTVDLASPGLSRSSMPAHSAAAIPVTRSPGVNLPPPAWAAAGALLIVIIWFLWPAGTPEIAQSSAKRFTQTMSFNAALAAADISPDGNKAAFIADGILTLDLTTQEWRRYPASSVYLHPEFSNDGSSLLLTGSNEIVRLSLLSSSMVPVVETGESGPRANWRNDELVVYEENQTLFEVSITTGERRQVVVRDSLLGESDLDWPHVLPGGEVVVATSERGTEPAKIGFWDIDSGKNLGYLDYPGRRAQWLDPGHLLIHMDLNAYAVPIDFKTYTQTGPITTLAENLREEGLSASSEGTVLHAGFDFGSFNFLEPVVPRVFERVAGSLNTISSRELIPAARYRSIDVHPDGRRAAIVVVESTDIPIRRDIVILDLEQGTRRSITRDGRSDYPAWGVTGDSLFFIRTRPSGDDAVMVMAADGTGEERIVLQGNIPRLVDLNVSPDGAYIGYAQGVPPTIGLFSRLSILPTGKPRFVIETPNNNPRHLKFSPNSKFIAYEDDGGIFVQSLERPESLPFPLWESGMTKPQWAPDGSKVYAMDTDRSVHSVAVQTEPVFRELAPPEMSMVLSFSRTGGVFATLPKMDHFVLSFRNPGAENVDRPDSSAIELDIHFLVNVPELLNN